MRVPRYVPILKGRQGEMDALREVQPRTREAMLPLVELAPRGEHDDAEAVKKACEQLVGRLAKVYPAPLMLDGGLLNLHDEVVGGRGVVGLLALLAREEDLAAQPVLRLSDPSRAVTEAREAHYADGRGLTVRLLGDELDEDPDDLQDLLDTLLDHVSVPPGQVDLLLDVGAVDGDVAVRGASRLVQSLVRDLPSIDEWRTVTVAAGAFPVDLSAFTAWQIGERTRYDAQLFDRVHSKTIPRALDYGDYAVAHPALSVGPAFSPPPQLRYTSAEHWLVLKGRRTDPRGHEQFYDICRHIAARPDFTGVPTGAADARIAAGSPSGPGNGTTWRAIGTTHHLDYVTLRLTSLGEP